MKKVFSILLMAVMLISLSSMAFSEKDDGFTLEAELPSPVSPDAETSPTPEEGDPEMFDIIIEETVNGRVTCDKDTAAEGENVNLTVEPFEDCYVISVAENGSEIQPDENGMYTFVMPGNAVRITAGFMMMTNDDPQEDIPVPQEEAAPVFRIVCDVDGEYELPAGSSLALSVEGLPAGAEGVSWSSSDGAVLTVDASGVVTAVTQGEAVVTASVTGSDDVPQTATLSIRVIGVPMTLTGSGSGIGSWYNAAKESGYQHYTSLAEALNDASEGDSIVWQASENTEVDLSQVNCSVLVSVDLNGKGLTMTGSGSLGKAHLSNGTIAVNGNVTLTDCGMIWCPITVYGGTFNISGGTLQGNDTTARVTVDSGATFNLSGGTITGTTGVSKYIAVSISSDAVCNMSGGTIENNSGVYNEGVFNLSGGTITCISSGPAVYNKSGTVHISGSAVISASTGSMGGGIYSVFGSVTMTGGTISGCASGAGGGVYIADCPFVMTGGTISGCTANAGQYHGGGAIYCTHESLYSASVSIGGSARITGNSVAEGGYGGGVYIDAGTFELSGNALIADNSASYGGGIYCTEAVTISGGTISGNIAINGGGLYGSLTMTGGMISDNQASFYGGGLYLSPYSSCLTGGTISGNSAGTCGGGIVIDYDSNVSESTGITFGGSIEITGNTPSNVQLWAGKYVIVSETVPFTTGKVGITTATAPVSDTPVRFAEGKLTHSTDFFSDVDGYLVAPQDGYLYLGIHEHEWSYVAVDNAIAVSDCTGFGTCPAKDTVIKLFAPTSAAYDGTPHAAILSSPTLGGEAVSIKYAKKTGDMYGDETADAPVNAGTYRASISSGGKTVSLEYTIAKGAHTLDQFPVTLPADSVYDGNARSASLGEYDVYSLGRASIRYVRDGVTMTGTIVNAGTYTVLLDVEESDNYQAETLECGSFTISRAENSITLSDTAAKTVKGAAEYTLPAVTSVRFGNVEDISVPDVRFTTPGLYTLTWSLSGTDNYMDATVSVNVIVTGYTITVVTEGNGTVVTDPVGTGVSEETLVTLTVTPDEDHLTEELTVKSAAGDILLADVTSFIMPAADVTVTVRFREAEKDKPAVTYSPAVPATCSCDGNREFWECDGKYYLSSSLTTEVSLNDILIPCSTVAHTENTISSWTWVNTGSSWIADYSTSCSVCGIHLSNGTDATVTENKTSDTITYIAEKTLGGITYTSEKSVTRYYTVTLDGENYGHYEYGDTVVVSRDDGKKYNWLIDGNTVSSGTESYSFICVSDAALVTDIATETCPTLSITSDGREDIGTEGRSRIRYTVRWAVPDGYTFIVAGIRRAYGVLPQDHIGCLTTYNTSSLKTRNGTYTCTINMSVATSRKTIGVSAYLIYRDSRGLLHIMYTPMIFTEGRK